MGLGSEKGLAVGDWSRVVQGVNRSFGYKRINAEDESSKKQ